MRTLSKSKLLAWRQCPKKLWLEVHQPDAARYSADAQSRFAAGNQVGAVAQKLYDPKGQGTILELGKIGMAALLAQTQELLPRRRPVFEAGFQIPGAMALADLLLPVGRGARARWRMVEVKSAASVKDYHRDDAAIQYHVATQSGLSLDSVAVAVVNKDFIYPGKEIYDGLLTEHDLTAEVQDRQREVADWISSAAKIVAKRSAPGLSTGAHCTNPVPCAFQEHCGAQEPKVAHPVTWLPRVQSSALKNHLADTEVRSLRDVPDELLNAKQLRVKKCTLSKKTYFDRPAAREAVASWSRPLYFLDFETIAHTVPVWKGLQPMQQVPFQFSLHKIDRNGQLSHTAFLDLSGDNPSKACAEALISACGKAGAIVSYNAAFEKRCIQDLAKRLPRLRTALLAIAERLVDLLPVMQEHYYHPAMQGSWSIKAVLPTIEPELRYDQLDTVQDGGGAQQAYLEATLPDTTEEQRQRIRQQLLEYCKLDTLAMVHLWQKITQD